MTHELNSSERHIIIFLIKQAQERYKDTNPPDMSKEEKKSVISALDVIEAKMILANTLAVPQALSQKCNDKDFDSF